MFGQLPELFGRNFLMGYFLPACITVAAVAGLLDARHCTAIYPAIWAYVASGNEKIPFGAVVYFLGIAWACAVILLGVNYPLTRALEGYGRFNPARLWRHYSLFVFRRLRSQLGAKEKTSDTAFAVATQRLAAEFPEHEDLVLATRFGNIMRAAERYPQVLYMIDAIQMWPRLESVMPESQRDAVAAARAALDFWINLWLGAILVGATEAILALCAGEWRAPIVLAALIFAIAVAKLAQAAASEFGLLVRASFDLYRGELSRQLGLKLPLDPRQEREMWKLLSQAMLFREPRALDESGTFRADA